MRDKTNLEIYSDFIIAKLQLAKTGTAVQLRELLLVHKDKKWLKLIKENIDARAKYFAAERAVTTIFGPSWIEKAKELSSTDETIT